MFARGNFPPSRSDAADNINRLRMKILTFVRKAVKKKWELFHDDVLREQRKVHSESGA